MGRPPNEDLYQLLAYCVSLGLKRGLLIYAGGSDRRYAVARADVVLEATGVDLTGDPKHIEAGARTAARLLLRAGGRFRGRGAGPVSE